MSKNLGIIDIGSNTLLMTCGTLDSAGKLQVLFEAHEVARLSEGLKDGGKLHDAAKKRVLDYLREFQREARQHGIEDLRAFGTAAFRRASDGAEFARQIEKELKIPTQILSGDREAFYSFLSAKNDFGKNATSLGMIDIGGGSTEVVFERAENGTSLALGTVGLAESLVFEHPISDGIWEKLRQNIRENLEKNLGPASHFHWLSQNSASWVAVAATPTSLAALLLELEEFSAEKVHGFILKRGALQDCVEKLRKLSIADRQKMKGMDVKRAELLPLGGIILLEIMNFLGLQEVIVSHHGLRYGILGEQLTASKLRHEKM